MLPGYLHEAACSLIEELENKQLCVILIPGMKNGPSDHGCIRWVAERNPSWYRELCRMFPRPRRRKRKEKYTDSYIKRQRVIKIIKDMMGNGSTTKLAQVLYSFVEERYAQNEIPF